MAPIPRSLPLIVQKSWKIRGHPFLLRLPIVHKLCPPPSLLPLLPWPHYPLIFNQYKGSANDMTSRECLSKSLEFDRNVCLVEEKKKVRLILSSWPESKLKEQFFLLFFFHFFFFSCHILHWKCRKRLLKIHPYPAWRVEVKCKPVLVRFKYSIFLSLVPP